MNYKEARIENIDTIFVLRQLVIDDTKSKHYRYYPKYTILQNRSTFCSTLEMAEDKIKEIAIENTRREKMFRTNVFCYYVLEFPINHLLYEDFSGNAKTVKVFDATGNMIDQTLCVGHDYLTLTHSEEKYFWGRNAKFKKGDIVECLVGNEVFLAIIALEPLSESFCKEYTERIRNDKNYKQQFETGIHHLIDLDSRNDVYGIVYEEIFPGYVPLQLQDSLRIFKPRYTIPSRIEKRLRKCCNLFYDRVKRDNIKTNDPIWIYLDSLKEKGLLRI